MYIDFEILTKSFGEAKILFFRVLGMWQFIGGFLVVCDSLYVTVKAYLAHATSVF